MNYQGTQWHESLGNCVTARGVVELAGTVSPLNLAQWLRQEFGELYPEDDTPTDTDFHRWAIDIIAEARTQ